MTQDRAVSLNAVMNIVSDMRGLCRQDVLQDTLQQLQQLPPVTPNTGYDVRTAKEIEAAIDKVEYKGDRYDEHINTDIAAGLYLAMDIFKKELKIGGKA